MELTMSSLFVLVSGFRFLCLVLGLLHFGVEPSDVVKFYTEFWCLLKPCSSLVWDYSRHLGFGSSALHLLSINCWNRFWGFGTVSVSCCLLLLIIEMWNLIQFSSIWCSPHTMAPSIRLQGCEESPETQWGVCWSRAPLMVMRLATWLVGWETRSCQSAVE